MELGLSYLNRLLREPLGVEQRLSNVRGFASEMRWVPSYEFNGSFQVEGVVENLIVEHGLENSAVLSFITSPFSGSNFDKSTINKLLHLSFNNLVDWHILLSANEILFINLFFL